jgi:long-chain acyl-CoA synthetase
LNNLIYFRFAVVGPRGEIIVGGPLVAKGYYNLAEKTAESFYQENGTNWFKTG